MNPVIMRKVPYRLPGTTRLVWAIILAEREGLTLLFVQRPGEDWNHEVAIGVENVAERVFEAANVSRFPVEHGDLAGIGKKLKTLGDGLSESELEQWLRSEGLF